MIAHVTLHFFLLLSVAFTRSLVINIHATHTYLSYPPRSLPVLLLRMKEEIRIITLIVVITIIIVIMIIVIVMINKI